MPWVTVPFSGEVSRGSHPRFSWHTKALVPCQRESEVVIIATQNLGCRQPVYSEKLWVGPSEGTDLHNPSYPPESALRTYCVPSTTSCDIELTDVAESRSRPTPEPTVPSPGLTVQTDKGQVCLRKVTGDGRESSDAPGNSGLRKGTEPQAAEESKLFNCTLERKDVQRGSVRERAQKTRNCRGWGALLVTLPQFPHVYMDPAVPLPCIWLNTSPPACVSPLSCELNATNRGKEVTGRPQTEVCPAETVLGKWSHCALLRLHSCPTRRKWDTEMLSNTYSVTAHAW